MIALRRLSTGRGLARLDKVEKPPKYSPCYTTACALDVGQVANLRGGWSPPPVRCGPIANRPQLTKLPRKPARFFMKFRGPKAHPNRPQKTMACPTGSLRNQAQLARVVRGRLGRGRPLEVVEVGVEPADQLIELEGRLPNIEKQAAPRATAPDAALPVDGGIISLVPGAASFELSGSDLQGG